MHKSKKILIERDYTESVIGISTKDIKKCLKMPTLRNWLAELDIEIRSLSDDRDHMEAREKDPAAIYRLYRYIGIQKAVRSQVIGQIQFIKESDRDKRQWVLLKRQEKLTKFLKEKLIHHTGSKELVYELIDNFRESEEYKMGYSKNALNRLKHDSKVRFFQ